MDNIERNRISLTCPHCKKGIRIAVRDNDVKDLKIQWVTVPIIGSCGHGIEFHYKNSDGICIGFIEDFFWRKDAMSQNEPFRYATVYTLSPDSEQWGSLSSKSVEILDDLKAYAYDILIRGEPEGGKEKHGIYSWING